MLVVAFAFTQTACIDAGAVENLPQATAAEQVPSDDDESGDDDPGECNDPSEEVTLRTALCWGLSLRGSSAPFDPDTILVNRAYYLTPLRPPSV